MKKGFGYFIPVVAGALLSASCAVGDMASSDFDLPDPPYDLDVSGCVIESAGGVPVGGVEVVLSSYSEGRGDSGTPISSVSTTSDARGCFSVRIREVHSGVRHRLSAGGEDASGNVWAQSYVDINVLSGSPSYDSGSNTFSVNGIVLSLAEDASPRPGGR